MAPCDMKIERCGATQVAEHLLNAPETIASSTEALFSCNQTNYARVDERRDTLDLMKKGVQIVAKVIDDFPHAWALHHIQQPRGIESAQGLDVEHVDNGTGC
eukprot:4822735-Prymnesium_polylepis.1